MISLSRARAGWIANAVEILAARPRPRLFEIRKLSSISRFEHEAQKKVASLPSLGLDLAIYRFIYSFDRKAKELC
jgi:hypothetical protein